VGSGLEQIGPWAVAQGGGWVVAFILAIALWRLATRYEGALISHAKERLASEMAAYKAMQDRAAELERFTTQLKRATGRRT
jgi:hypothetical protein